MRIRCRIFRNDKTSHCQYFISVSLSGQVNELKTGEEVDTGKHTFKIKLQFLAHMCELISSLCICRRPRLCLVSFYILIFSSETAKQISTKLGVSVKHLVLYQMYEIGADQ